MIGVSIGALSLAIWIYLLSFRGMFWSVRVEPAPAMPDIQIRVTAVIPARDEAAGIGRAIASLAGQEIPGELDIIVVDDHSGDGTADCARAAAAANGAEHRLTVLPGAALPDGWTGKLWAMAQGIDHARQHRPDYLLLTDADIEHGPGAVAALIARAETGDLDLASLMVKLRCQSWAERWLIPAFVFFFFMLYPPRRVARPGHPMAAAAGGCMLIRPAALDRIGGIGTIRGALIDDCALGQAVKRSGGRIWMGVTDSTISIREYPSWRDIWAMIARTAYTQLGYSPLLLVGTLIGLGITYMAPPLLLATGDDLAATLGFAAWLAMALAFAPILRLYGRPGPTGLLLPLIALFYAAATIGSAVNYWRGRGGVWKGRPQAIRKPPTTAPHASKDPGTSA
ncbi:MAG TPA: glycosyltransferase [Stellaceae bacterium]|nr:glycosyltransferase [Stellaceae bacterium]